MDANSKREGGTSPPCNWNLKQTNEQKKNISLGSRTHSVLFDTLTHVEEEEEGGGLKNIIQASSFKKHYGNVNHKHTSN